VSLALFTDMVLYDMIVPILPTLLKNIGRNDDLVGVLFAIYAVGFLVATPIFGIWSDRSQTRKFPMILGQAGLAIATVLFAMADSFWLLVVARLLQGVAAAVSWTLGLALLADVVPEEEHGSAMGIVFGFNTLGYFVGPLVGGVLTQVVNIQTPFIIGSGLCIIDLIARGIIKPPPPMAVSAIAAPGMAVSPDTTPAPAETAISTEQNDSKSPSNPSEWKNLAPVAPLPLTGNNQLAPSTVPTPIVESAKKRKPTLWKLLRYPEVSLVGLVVTCTSISFSAVETLLASYLEHRYNQTVMQVSFSMMAIIIPSVVFSFLAGWLSDRVCRYRLILVSSALYLPATALLGAAPNLVTFLLASAYFGATSSILQAPTLPEMGAIVGRLGGGSYAQIYGILNICYSMGMLVGPLIASALNRAAGFLITMIVIAAPFVLIIPIFAWLARLSSRGELASMRAASSLNATPHPGQQLTTDKQTEWKP
jgi:multidrug resistance protein